MRALCEKTHSLAQSYATNANIARVMMEEPRMTIVRHGGPRGSALLWFVLRLAAAIAILMAIMAAFYATSGR